MGPHDSPGSGSRRIAPGDEAWDEKVLRALTETQSGPLGIGDFPASGRDDRVACRDIPFAGGGEARIDIDRTLRDLREFDGRAQPLPDRTWPSVDKGFGRGIAMRTAHRRDP